MELWIEKNPDWEASKHDTDSVIQETQLANEIEDLIKNTSISSEALKYINILE